ncbi:helix-turn-helix domain-containing protein [Acetobacterium wieringae]|uniref:Helix-turn-helix domain-containing protein n=1 Tax=Acetobacterium wieringae TaxID=52694 RepID=A0ABY6HG05_9FIRM|nr:helix-turn-helix domain-containing protein [Acetobacterium wieringae]UYO62829.1 helix-turn-helix domain-containing protein [Acetobacterium wieringae]
MFGKRLKQLRESREITQQELADILNVSVGTIGMYEIDKRLPNNKNREKIAKYFNVSSDYLLGNTDDPLPVRDVDQDLHDEHDYNKELDAFLNDDEMSSMFYDYKNWTEEEKRNLLNILKGQEALRQMNKKK